MAEDTQSPNYLLERSYLASVRLNLVHSMMKEELGYLLHPSIAPQPDDKKVICDMGMGTGQWLLDLAAALPSSSLHGYDIDISQAPPNEWLPSNVTINSFDIFEPIAEDLLERFDIIHVQLFMCVVKDNNPRPVIDKLLRLLKPGGWLQWVELDLSTRSFHKANDSLSIEKLVEASAFQDTLATMDPRSSPRWVATLSKSFEEAGLHVVVDERKVYSESRRPIFTDTAFMTWHEFNARLKGKRRDEFSKLIMEAEEEVAKAKRAVAVTLDNRIAVGQKGLK